MRSMMWDEVPDGFPGCERDGQPWSDMRERGDDLPEPPKVRLPSPPPLTSKPPQAKPSPGPDQQQLIWAFNNAEHAYKLAQEVVCKATEAAAVAKNALEAARRNLNRP